jgi:thioredoxin-dependent peroxiredoxin
MSSPTAGSPAPDVSFSGPDGPLRLLEAVAEGPLILVFFQEANTPLCEAQVRGFAADHDLVQELGARVLAVSADPPEAQARFGATLAAPFPIVTDPDGAAARAFGVWDEGTRRGNRAVFVIGRDGTVLHAEPWYNPRNAGQLEAVFTALGVAG